MEKLFPDNPHHYNYSEALGWEHLGTDDKYDYYVNHKYKYLSIVYGHEGHEYASPLYSHFQSPKFLDLAYDNADWFVIVGNEFQAYLKLYELLTNQKDKHHE